jgi:hypothetical protein
LTGGANVDELSLHLDPYFGNWSLERSSQMPVDLKRKLKRMRFIHSKTGEARKQAEPDATPDRQAHV